MSAACATCRYWSAANEDDWTGTAVGFRLCTGVRERWVIQDEAVKDLPSRWEMEDEEPWDRARTDALRNAKAYVQDGSEYRADLFTGPDFFCALYSPSTPDTLGDK